MLVKFAVLRLRFPQAIESGRLALRAKRTFENVATSTVGPKLSVRAQIPVQVKLQTVQLPNLQ